MGKNLRSYPEYIRESLVSDERLLDASNRGDTKKVKELLDSGADIECKDKYGMTPLMKASANGNTETVRLLLDYKANVNDRYNAPLILASRYGNIEIVKMLLDNNAIVNITNKEFSTPLMWASRNGETKIVKLLLDRGAGINSIDKHGETPLILASCYGRYDRKETVKLLLKHDADINVYDDAGICCLDYNKELWEDKEIQEFIIDKQPHNIKLLDDKIGILPSLKIKSNKKQDTVRMDSEQRHPLLHLQ